MLLLLLRAALMTTVAASTIAVAAPDNSYGLRGPRRSTGLGPRSGGAVLVMDSSDMLFVYFSYVV